MNEPKVRFKGFEGEWEEKKLGEFGYVSMCKRIFKNQTTTMGDVPFYKIGTFGSAPDAYISKSLYEEYKRLYSFPQKGDILLSAAGTIGRTVEYDGEDAYFQDSNIVWLNHDEKLDNRFLKYLYSIITWSSLEGATIKRLYNSNILESKCRIPSLPEQCRIASYFTHLDTLIEASRQKVEKLKQVKAASLQSFFPTHGQRTPKIRFKGCEGEWNVVKIGEVAPLQGGFAFQSTSFRKYGIPIVRISNILNSGEIGGAFTFYKGVIPSQFSLSQGDAVIAMSGATTGKTAVVKDNGFYYLNQRVGKFARTGKIYYPFVATYIQSYYFVSKLQNLLSSSAQPNISTFDVNSIQINVPTDKSEQRKIASYFTHLDTLLTLERQRYAKLQQVKRASLTQMFA